MTKTTASSGSQEDDQHRGVNVLGVEVTPWTSEDLIAAIIHSAARHSHQAQEPLSTVHYANVHVLNTAYRDAALRAQLARASTVYCDGSGVRLGAAILGRRLPPRLAAADIIDDFCAAAAREGTSLFIVGGAEGVARRGAAVLRARHSGLQIAGSHHGFLDDETSAAVVIEANAAAADVMLVGMGTPLQEQWVARYRNRIDASVVWTVGALMDFVVGVQRRGPTWLTDNHMEWLWRLGTDPRRLAKRYLVGNPVFCIRVLRQRLGQRTSGSDG